MQISVPDSESVCVFLKGHLFVFTKLSQVGPIARAALLFDAPVAQTDFPSIHGDPVWHVSFINVNKTLFDVRSRCILRIFALVGIRMPRKNKCACSLPT